MSALINKIIPTEIDNFFKYVCPDKSYSTKYESNFRKVSSVKAFNIFYRTLDYDGNKDEPICINFSNHKIEIKLVEKIVDYWLYHTSRTNLEISGGYNFFPEHIECISEKLPDAVNLKVLKLSHMALSDTPSLSKLLFSVSQNPRLMNLDLYWGNTIFKNKNYKNISLLADFIRSNTTLKTIKIFGSKLDNRFKSPEPYDLLIDALRVNTTLVGSNVNSQKYPEKTEIMRSLFQRNIQLQEKTKTLKVQSKKIEAKAILPLDGALKEIEEVHNILDTNLDVMAMRQMEYNNRPLVPGEFTIQAVGYNRHHVEYSFKTYGSSLPKNTAWIPVGCIMKLAYYYTYGMKPGHIPSAISYHEINIKHQTHGQYKSMTELGILYESSSKKDKLELVVEYYKIASEHGVVQPQAHDLLGRCYERGIGVEKDLKKAFELYGQSVLKSGKNSQLASRARYNLGCCYLFGSGVEQDLEKAKEHFLAAEKWYPPANRVLSILVEKDLIKIDDMEDSFRMNDPRYEEFKAELKRLKETIKKQI